MEEQRNHSIFPNFNAQNELPSTQLHRNIKKLAKIGRVRWLSKPAGAHPGCSLVLEGNREEALRESSGQVYLSDRKESHFILKLDMTMEIIRTYLLICPVMERRPRELTKVIS